MRRTVTVVALTALLGIASVQSVAARDMSFQRSNGIYLQTQWIQLDRYANGDRIPPLESRPLGNVHIGFLVVDQTSSSTGSAFGQIADLDCPVDYVPPMGGGHGGLADEGPGEPENPCEHIGFRQLQGENLPMTVDRKLTSARVGSPTSRIGVFGGDPHSGGGTPLGTAPINVVWTGVGDLTTSKNRSTWSDGTWTYTESWTSATRTAVMSGELGPMGFDPELSGGTIEKYSQFSRSRSR